METAKLTIWIYIFAAISILSAAVGVYGGYVNGQFFYAEFPAELWERKLVKHLAGMWASKNLAIIIVLGYGLWSRNFRWLAAIFLFKFISDSLDILYVNIMFREGQAASVITNFVSWLILALPSGIAAYLLNKAAKKNSSTA